MKSFIVGKNESGQRMDKLLFKILPETGRSFLYKMLRKKNITLNDKKAEGKEILTEGDEIKIWFSDDTFNKFSGTESDSFDNIPTLETNRIIYENENILIYDKPAGLLSQRSENGDISLNEMFISYLLINNKISKEEMKTFRPSICNRLDRNTSGLVICGKTLKGLQDTADELKGKKLKKDYLAIVNSPVSEGHEDDNIFYKPVYSDGKRTLLMIRLFEGKKHKIRISLSDYRLPILGDVLYGGEKYSRYLLHAYKLTMEEGRSFIAPVPQDIKEAIRGYKWEHGKPEDFEDLPLRIS